MLKKQLYSSRAVNEQSSVVRICRSASHGQQKGMESHFDGRRAIHLCTLYVLGWFVFMAQKSYLTGIIAIFRIICNPRLIVFGSGVPSVKEIKNKQTELLAGYVVLLFSLSNKCQYVYCQKAQNGPVTLQWIPTMEPTGNIFGKVKLELFV